MIYRVAIGLFLVIILNQTNNALGNAGFELDEYSDVKQLSNNSLPLENVSINLTNRFIIIIIIIYS